MLTRSTPVRHSCLTLVCQLNRRCGPLAGATTAQIRALAVDELEALADALLDFQGPADLAAWLAATT